MAGMTEASRMSARWEACSAFFAVVAAAVRSILFFFEATPHVLCLPPEKVGLGCPAGHPCLRIANYCCEQTCWLLRFYFASAFSSLKEPALWRFQWAQTNWANADRYTQ